jgi:hypothetical protein
VNVSMRVGLSRRKEERLLPTRRRLQEASPGPRGATRDGSGANEVPRSEVAPAQGVMRNHLGPREVPAIKTVAFITMDYPQSWIFYLLPLRKEG